MKTTRIIFLIFTLFLVPFSCVEKPTGEQGNFTSFSEHPPMGWNSYDAYHGAITEEQFLNCVDWISENLLPAGYEYAVIDFCWYRPARDPDWYEREWETFPLGLRRDSRDSLLPELVVDPYGRVMPDTLRWPSASNGAGFKKVGDYVHSKGMKFGIHIMRGIPRQAVWQDLPIKESRYFASDVTREIDTCPWMNHMYGVDSNKPGAQEYYNSLFNLYASWGVDFVKADDMMVPPYHAGEIELMRKAIDQCGRPIILSLSCGEAPLSFAKHLSEHANMWRISSDFWDEWEDMLRIFELAEMWSPFIGEGTWPDADMIPIGNLCLTGYPNVSNRPGFKRYEHQSHLTPPEQRALMSLWCIIRSPLMWGGDPLSSSPESIRMISNENILAVSKNSINNRQIYERNSSRVWIADILDSEEKYLGIFNLSDHERAVPMEFFWDKTLGESYRIIDLWTMRELGVFNERFAPVLQGHEGRLYRLEPSE